MCIMQCRQYKCKRYMSPLRINETTVSLSLIGQNDWLEYVFKHALVNSLYATIKGSICQKRVSVFHNLFSFCLLYPPVLMDK